MGVCGIPCNVFDRMIIDYHIGLSCTAADASRVVKNALRKRGLYKGAKMPKLRTDNGPQFIAEKFQETCEKLEIIHERIPVKTPNLNAHIEAFHSILETERYSRHEFQSFMEAYAEVSRYIEYYNRKRKHGSLRHMSPEEFHKAFMSKLKWNLLWHNLHN
ncbi:integrase core domain-containing protein [Calderihabitans maritimus]|uniref:Integrase catalytic subunit n=1 Tax=Calderihabitans maritimus TaxID=1246530 RepID=A0A1Z5HVH2_9FIRM|nr:integrase core domain-containing protein [Calderihabitans maritimus]GAW93539.1 integrase catalytic subunit [Calderihabitans maritimus]